MAYKKITELDGALTISDTDLIEIVSNVPTTPVSKKSTFSVLKAWIQSFSGSETWITKTADFTAEAGGNYAVDTTTGVVVCTLLAAPSLDDKISFLDLKQNFGTNALDLLRNGELIMGDAEDVSIDRDNFNFSMVYTSNGWIII